MRPKSVCCQCSWFVSDGVGIGCAIFTYLLVAYAEIVVVFVMLLPEIPLAGMGLVHAVVFTYLSILAVVAHVRAMLTDPGTIPLGNCTSENIKKLRLAEGQTILRCTRCECIKLERAHHCSTCQRCIRRMDHHCPWINNCVGEDNQKFFILFTLYIFTISIYALMLAVRQVLLCSDKDWIGCTGVPMPSSILLIIFLIFEGLLFGIFTLVMFCSQVTSVARDETGIENLKNEKRARKQTVYENLQEVFGGNFSISWFSPFAGLTNKRTSYSFYEV
ncbi:palmitoyltransferase ZDHHC3-like [Actinia tenebrosa]|uniref:Palmitoyltransferase n=1 Tax=Actinia tenebrosa TaxID=6105 RepID=A0A6P8IRC2_ACTTE|nr:palmitoyltransferase ZDHHC3-like [Actinia tenebrosa]